MKFLYVLNEKIFCSQHTYSWKIEFFLNNLTSSLKLLWIQTLEKCRVFFFTIFYTFYSNSFINSENQWIYFGDVRTEKDTQYFKWRVILFYNNSWKMLFVEITNIWHSFFSYVILFKVTQRILVKLHLTDHILISFEIRELVTLFTRKWYR